MDILGEAELCFPLVNNSCRRIHSQWELTFSESVVSCIILLTVVLNLLVIISISYYRQLYTTTTNHLLLSLAAADFLVGLLQMPAYIVHIQGCWTLGDTICAMDYFLGHLNVGVSVGNMMLISIDRYVAICDPMFYSTKVTLKRVQFCVCLCWIGAAVHSTWILRDFLKQPARYGSCYGECLAAVGYSDSIVDLILSFIGPILVIILLYMRVFVVAVSQARAMRSHITSVTLQGTETVKAKKSEMKAARTLGVVVVVFLLCSCPFYCVDIVKDSSYELTAFTLFLLYVNSCLNPVIYVYFYPWFRKAIKHIVTLEILKPGAHQANLL